MPVQGGNPKNIDGRQLRQCILDVVAEFSKQGSGYFQVNPILGEVATRLGRDLSLEMQQAVLTVWHDLFRIGLLAWGYNLSNPSAPFCHLTESGRQTLKHVSRDPANPDGYLAYLDSRAGIDAISRSYLEEALICYNSGCYKAAAVMVGATAESLILRLRDALVKQLTAKSQPISKGCGHFIRWNYAAFTWAKPSCVGLVTGFARWRV